MSSLTSLVTNAASGLRNLAGRGDERLRQALAEDARYTQPMFAFFELRLGQATFLFPLVAGVQAYTLQEPFAVDVVPTDNAGLGVHRSGIIQRRLQLSGHTGFAPQDLPIAPLLPKLTTFPKNYNSRDLPRSVVLPISGQRIFEYLQEEVFRAYSDACRNPATAEDAALFFHNPRDKEHWRVEPASFNLQRNQQSNYTYPWTIDLIIIGPAAETTYPLSASDKGVIDRISDSVQSITDALADLRGAIDDLTSVQGSFKVLAQQVVGIIDSASYVVQAATDFTNGTRAFINVPRAAVYALFNACTDVCALFASLVDTGTGLADWPRSIVARFRAIQNACDALLVQTGAFAPPLPERLKLVQDETTGLNSVTRAAVTSFDDINRAGTAELPGAAAAYAETAQAGEVPVYRSVRQVTVRQGDTLQRIAAKEMGSTSAWRAIALLNDLKAPQVGAGDRRAAGPGQLDAFAGVLTYGQQLLIPSTDPPPEQVTNPAVLGVSPDAAQDEKTLGRDLRLANVSSAAGDARYDLQLGSNDGVADLDTHAGIAQLSQAVEQNIVISRGSSSMFPDVGLDQLIGTGYAQVDESLRNFRITQVIQADPRVALLDNLSIRLGGPGLAADALVIQAQVTAVGSAAPAQVAATI